MQIGSNGPLEQVNRRLCNTYTQICPRLKFLELTGDFRSVSHSASWNNLLYWKAECREIGDLSKIIRLAPDLRSFDIHLIRFNEMINSCQFCDTET